MHESSPLPSLRARIPFDRSFTAVEFERVRQEIMPQTMEERWFVVFEDPWLHIGRSWTGFTIFDMRIVQDGDRYRIAEVWANRDPDQYGETDLRREAETLRMVIDHIILENPGA